MRGVMLLCHTCVLYYFGMCLQFDFHSPSPATGADHRREVCAHHHLGARRILAVRQPLRRILGPQHRTIPPCVLTLPQPSVRQLVVVATSTTTTSRPPPPQLLPMHPTMCRAQETRWVVWRASTTNPRGLWIAADFVFFLPSEEKLGSAKWSSYSLALLITSTADMPRCCAAKVDHQRLGWYAQTPVSWCHFTHTHLQGCGRKHFFAEEVATIPKRGGANHFCFF